MTIHAYAAAQAGGALQPFEYDPGPIRGDQVEIEVEYCGICRSDLSMLDNHWEMTQYPFVPGHEVVGRIVATGPEVRALQKGQRVGLGWNSGSCLMCEHCLAGDQNLCPQAEGVIVGRHGGFADRVRAQETWAVPVPEGIDPQIAGPLFCGGITVFNPLVQHAIRPTSRVGVVGIGGLGHMALQFLNAWGCEVTAFSTSPDKEAEAREMGAHDFINSRDAGALGSAANRFDMILVTVDVGLDWDAYMAALRPRGVLHLVGATPSITATVFPMIVGQKSISASPLGSPATTRAMLEFVARHDICPLIETYPLAKVNDAMEKLRNGSPRYRLVLEVGGH